MSGLSTRALAVALGAALFFGMALVPWWPAWAQQQAPQVVVDVVLVDKYGNAVLSRYYDPSTGIACYQIRSSNGVSCAQVRMWLRT